MGSFLPLLRQEGKSPPGNAPGTSFSRRWRSSEDSRASSKSSNNLYRPVRAGRDAELTRNALFLTERNPHFRSRHAERCCGAKGCAGSTPDAAIFVPADLLRKRLETHIQVADKTQAFIKISFLAGYFNRQLPLFSRRHSRPQNVHREIILLDQLLGNGLIDQVRRKTENQSFFCHAVSFPMGLGGLKRTNLQATFP
jgi:hypothetical protein